MIPLTPVEVREIEKVKDLIVKGHNCNDATMASWIPSRREDYLELESSEEGQEFWLKVLAMALEGHRVTLEEWNAR